MKALMIMIVIMFKTKIVIAEMEEEYTKNKLLYVMLLYKNLLNLYKQNRSKMKDADKQSKNI